MLATIITLLWIALYTAWASKLFWQRAKQLLYAGSLAACVKIAIGMPSYLNYCVTFCNIEVIYICGGGNLEAEALSTSAVSNVGALYHKR